MNKLVICIFPKDATTDFVEPIFNAIKNASENFVGYRIDTNNEADITRLKTDIEALDDNCTIVFLGHGASNCLYGTPIKEKNIILFNREQLSVIKSKTNFIFACNSNELLKNLKSDHYIGFGDMPTDYSEIISTRDLDDPSYLSGVTDREIEIYKHCIVDIIEKSIIKCKLDSLENLYRHIKLFANIKIANTLSDKKNDHYREIVDLLYYWKDDMVFKP